MTSTLKRVIGTSILPIAAFALLILAWDLATRLGEIRTLVLPSPVDVGEALVRGFTPPYDVRSSFVYHLWPTLQATLLGFVVATAVSVGLGIGLVMSRTFRRAIWPLLVAFQGLPKVAVAPLLVVWFGPTLESKVILAAVVAFFPVLINTVVGLESLDADTEEMMRSFSASGSKILRFGRFPAAMPMIFAGLQSAILLSLVAVVVGEFVAAQRGLGVLMIQAMYVLDVPAVFAILFVFSALGVILSMAMSLVERRVVFWRRSSSSVSKDVP